MTEMQVHSGALETFARSSDNRRRDFDDVKTKAAQVRVGRESFGKIPGIGSRVYEAYDEHVRACEDGIASAAEAMAGIASGVRAVITNTDNANEAIQESLRGIHIRGVE
jgi:hypothetical protein